MELIHTGHNSSGECTYQKLLFVPVGSFEFTAYAGQTSISLRRYSAGSPPPFASLWSGGYGENVKVTSSWTDVTHPLPATPSGVGQTDNPHNLIPTDSAPKSEPVSLLRLNSTPKLQEMRHDSFKAFGSRLKVMGAPWFVGQRSDEPTVALLNELCDAVIHTELSAPSGDCASVSSSFLGVLAACVLVHHVDPKLVCCRKSGPLQQTLMAVAGLISDILRTHAPSSSIKVVSHAIGYSGERAGDVLRAIESLSKQLSQKSTATSPLPLNTALPPITKSTQLLSEAVTIVFRWAFEVVPAHSECMAQAGGPMSHVALDFADAAIELNKRHPVITRMVQLLVQQLLVMPTVVCEWRVCVVDVLMD